MSNVIKMLQNIDTNTVIVYVTVILLATFFAFIYQKKKHKKKAKGYLVLAFLPIWIMLAFSNCGTDYPAYEEFFLNSLNPEYWIAGEMERGFLLFFAIVRFFTDSFEIFHIIWATVMLLLIYKTFVYYKNFIHTGYAMFAFASVYCIQSMNIMRIFFAAAMVFYATRYLLNKQYFKYTVAIVITSFIHISSIVMLLPLVFLMMFPSPKKYLFKTFVFVVAIFAVFAARSFIFGGNLMGYTYGLNAGGSLGVANIIYHIPLIIFFVVANKSDVFSKEANKVFFVLMMTSFAVGFLSYYIDLIGRMYVYFESVYVLFPAYYLNSWKTDKALDKSQKMSNRFIWATMFIVVMLLRVVLSIEYFVPDQTMPYTWIFSN